MLDRILQGVILELGAGDFAAFTALLVAIGVAGAAIIVLSSRR